MAETILIIDDDDIIRMVLRKVLEKSGYSILEAENGDTGLKLALEKKPSTIFLDRNMPVMDGNATLIHLKNTTGTKNIPVIMLTGDKALSDIETSKDLGANDYIVKPFDSDAILSSLNKVMETA